MTTSAADFPAVTQEDVFSDQQWFADHPSRQYRLRDGWTVRRRARGVFLRTPLASDRRYPDNDERLAEFVWWAAAFPHLSPQERKALAKTAGQRTKPPGARKTLAKTG